MKYEKAWSLPVFTAGENGYTFFRIPSVITLPGGRILAFAEGRRNSLSDSGIIDIVVRISDDGGRSFGPIRVVIDGVDGTAGNQCPVYDDETGKLLLLFNRNNADGPEPLILQGKAPRTVHITESADQGETWKEEREITAQTKKPLWTWHAMGPCHAVKLPSGRIVIPCNHAVLDEAKGQSGPYRSHTLFSDDHGATWQIGEGIHENTNECSLALRKDGKLLMNMRTFGELVGCRALAVSENDGVSFSHFRLEKNLPDPCCQGAMLAVEAGGEQVILCSNSASPTERVNLSIHESHDGGETWSEGCLVSDKCTAYSDLTEPKAGQIGILYEMGEKMPYEKIEWTVYQIG